MATNTKEYMRKYQQKNKERIKKQRAEYYQKNKEYINAKNMENHYAKKEERNAKQREYNNSHKEERRKRDNANIERKRERENVYRRQRYANDPSFRVLISCRTRIRKALEGIGEKSQTTKELVGCSMDELRKHLESQFVEGMSWDNYGEWHIDHIKPCASFNLEDSDEQKECFNYTNLQPLWAIDNLVKGCKV